MEEAKEFYYNQKSRNNMAYIKALSCFTPPYSLDNEVLQVQLKDTCVAKTAKGVGVATRHIASDETTAGDMAIEAANRLFEKSGVRREEIDFVIMATQSPDHFLPPTACIIQDKLRIPTTAGAFDFDLGCSGYVYGLAIAGSFVDSGLAKNVLLLTGDTITRFIHPEDNNRVLFGEAASATLVSTTGIARIGKFEKGSDGSGADCLIVKNGAARHLMHTGQENTDSEGNTRRDDYFYMDGTKVFNFTVDCVPSLINNTLEQNSLSLEEVDHVILHQANKFMLNTLRKLCHIPKDKFYINLENTGNTTSTTIPLGLEDCLNRGLVKKGEKVLVAGFGVGLSWAGTVLSFEQ